jgi:hypothetical protein
MNGYQTHDAVGNMFLSEMKHVNYFGFELLRHNSVLLRIRSVLIAYLCPI